jgi:hypothetical protein
MLVDDELNETIRTDRLGSLGSNIQNVSTTRSGYLMSALMSMAITAPRDVFSDKLDRVIKMAERTQKNHRKLSSADPNCIVCHGSGSEAYRRNNGMLKHRPCKCLRRR